MSSLTLELPAPRARWSKRTLIPIGVGVLAALAMLGMYIGILTVFQSFSHAMEQFAIDFWIVLLVAAGFGAQMGLYAYLRVVVYAAQAASRQTSRPLRGATAMTGAGTGTSTLGMIACCAHHLTDLAPLVALTGASGLSGAISFLTEWKYAFIAIGLVVNAGGMFITIRTIRRARAHLKAMLESFAAEAETTPACH